MKTILVPTDFSEYANNALLAAFDIALKNQAKLVLMHTVEVSSGAFITPSGMSADNSLIDGELMLHFTENAKRKLESLLKDHAHYQEVSVEYVVEIGKLFPSVLEVIRELNVSLVVMGSKGKDGLDELLIGSNTEKMVRTAPCPVLAIKGGTQSANFRHIVFATNLEEDQLIATKKLKEFQALFDAKVYLLRVNTPTDFMTTREANELFLKYIEKYQISNCESHLYCDLDQDDGILHFAQAIGADLIALATNQRRGLSHLFLGSIAEDVVNQAQRPVLTFNNKTL